MESLPKRLGVGKGVRGPEFYGCFNTGMAPVILKSKHLDKYRPAGYRFVVGPELYVGDAAYHRVLGKTSHKSKDVRDGRTVYFYKTYASAKKRFNTLSEVIRAANEEDRKRVAELKAKAAKGDMQAVCDLGDYL